MGRKHFALVSNEKKNTANMDWKPALKRRGSKQGKIVADLENEKLKIVGSWVFLCKPFCVKQVVRSVNVFHLLHNLLFYNFEFRVLKTIWSSKYFCNPLSGHPFQNISHPDREKLRNPVTHDFIPHPASILSPIPHPASRQTCQERPLL